MSLRHNDLLWQKRLLVNYYFYGFVMKNLLLLLLAGLIVPPFFLSTSIAQPSNCDSLLNTVANAVGAYNKATGSWRQATVKVSQAEFEVSEAEKNLEINDKAQREALGELESAKAEQAACEMGKKGEPLAPLTDCSKVPERINKAEKKYNDLAKANDKLEDNLKEKKNKLEEREQEAATAHEAQRKAYADQEAAKNAAAGCHKAS
jgi:chromosome segregation ATPase